MPLSHEHQITLLKDILNNQQTDCCGSVAEYEQVERLVKSLMVNMNINDDIKTVLTEIYNYSQTGINTNNSEDHITTNQNNLSQWVNEMDSFS